MVPHDPSAGTLVVDVACLAVDAVTVDALARLQLAASRSGRQVVLRGASSELRELLTFMGLEDRLPDESLGLEARR
jgi:ABC-type transporter Mla MlaB component